MRSGKVHDRGKVVVVVEEEEEEGGSGERRRRVGPEKGGIGIECGRV
jgi:hypothetical protein